MQNRREFLKRASLMLAGGMVMPQLLTSCAGKASASESSKYIGLQLYSLRDQLAMTMARSMVWLLLSSRRW